MGKRPHQQRLEDNPSFVFEVEDFFDWNSPEGQFNDEVMNAVWAILEKVDVDARKRKLIWPDGQRLSINQSVKRIHNDHPSFPLEWIDSHLTAWLETVFVPQNYSQEQLDEFDRLTDKWVDDHDRIGK
jgi:hypothetical protein